MLSNEIAAAAAAFREKDFDFYLVSNGAVLEHLDHRPHGVQVTALDFLGSSPVDWDVQDLMRVYHTLNRVSFGPAGIPMESWTMIDLGLLPSAFMLVTLPLDRVVAEARDPDCEPNRRWKLDSLAERAEKIGYDGPVPIAGYCAAPTPEPGRWVGWSLCSVGWRVGGGHPSISVVTKGLALAAYRAGTLVGISQYDNRALRIHRSFGRMRMLTAVLDLHPRPHSFVYLNELTAPDEDAEPTWHVAANDVAKHREMQGLLDAGTHELYVVRPGLDDEGRVPVLAKPVG